MTPETRQKVERIRSELIASPHVHLDARDSMHSLLDAAEKSANGVNDAERVKYMSAAILELAMCEVKKSIRDIPSIQNQVENAVKSAISNHVTTCPFGNSASRYWVGVATRLLPWIAALIISVMPYIVERVSGKNMDNQRTSQSTRW